MLNVLMPMAGSGSRFSSSPYDVPKPLIPIDNSGTRMFMLATFPVATTENFIFVVRSDLFGNDLYEPIISDKYRNYEIISQDGAVNGAVSSTLYAEHLIDNDTPLLILDSDIYSVWDMETLLEKASGLDGAILTFESSNPAYSYVKLGSDDVAVDIAEKSVISNNASAGGYFWAKGSEYVKYAKQLVASGKTTNGEFYISNVYKTAMLDGKRFTNYEVKKHFSLGTPEDLEAFIAIRNLENGSYRTGLVEFDELEAIEVDEFKVEELGIDNSILRLTNLFRLFDVEKPTKILKGKTFVAPLSRKYWHFLHESLAQYEVLKKRIPDLKIYFVDFHGLAARDGFEDSSTAFCKGLAEFYLDPNEFSNIFKDLDVQYRIPASNLLFEEAYFISDYEHLVPPTAWEHTGFTPPWYREDIDWVGDHWVGPDGRDAWIKEGVQLLRERLITSVRESEDYPEKMYVSRRDATERYRNLIKDGETSDTKSINEARERNYDETNLENYFIAKGYEPVCLEGMPYREQMNYFHNAKKIAGLVGSGFCNLIFSRPDVELIELHVSATFEFSYSYLIRFLGLGQIYTKIDLRYEDPRTWKYSEITWDEMIPILDKALLHDEA